MSNFLAFESYLIPLGADTVTVQSTIDAALTSKGYQRLRKSIVPTLVGGTASTQANALDRDINTSAGHASVGTNLYIQLSTPLTPTKMVIVAQRSAAITYSPRNFTLDYSDNGSSWTTHRSWTGEVGWRDSERRVYTITGAAPHSFWRFTVTMRNDGSAGGAYAEWGLEDSAGNLTTTIPFSDFIPPVTELVGNADSRDILRINYGPTYIRFVAYQERLRYSPHVLGIADKTAGAVTPSVTIGGVTVSGSLGGAGDTSKTNLRSLYEAIRASVDPTITDYTWEYQKLSPQGATGTLDYIIGVCKSDTPDRTYSGTNVDVYKLMEHSQPVVGLFGSPVANISLTTDLINGFIYYLQINSRGIALATKTNSDYFGPIHACWADHTKATAVLPPSGWTIDATPIELVVGWDDVATSTGSTGKTSHGWGVTDATPTVPNVVHDYSVHPFGHGLVRLKIMDVQVYESSPYGSADFPIALYGSNLFTGADPVGNDFQVHRVSMIGEKLDNAIVVGSANLRRLVPCLEIQDWYKFCGTATNEALLMVADTVTITKTNGPCTNVAGTINVDSTAGFQTSGYLVIESEIIQYTGISPTSFTGCTRGRYGTVAVAHYDDDVVSQGLWFTKINGGALFCGFVKPA